MATKPKSNCKKNDDQESLIGEILVEANLISSAQLELALANQHEFLTMKLGEIIALRGWLKQQTIDFLVQNIHNSNPENDLFSRKLIGQYFQEAGLLTQEQINIIIEEQKKTGLKFGYIAVVKGFLTETTLNFFIEKVINKLEAKNSSFEQNETQADNLSALFSDSGKDQNFDEDKTLLEKTTIITPSEIVECTIDEEAQPVYCDEVAYSPIWIDY